MKSKVTKIHILWIGFWMHLDYLLLYSSNIPYGFASHFRIPVQALSWIKPLLLMCSIKIYNAHFLIPFSIFCHMVLTFLQLKCPTALCLTLHCHFVWLIKPPCLSPPYKYHHLPSTSMGTTPALATPTQLSDQTQLHVPFISAEAAWPRGSSVNLWSQSIIYSPTRPEALHCH